jgi:AraC-like DNA-binding protein
LDIVGPVESWSASLPKRSIDDRILRAIAECRRCEAKKISLSELAWSIHISGSRLVHLFKGETDVPVRRCLKWLRMVHAVARIQATDSSLTAVAHEARFADAAHLIRTPKEMFGIPPSLVFKQQPDRSSSLARRVQSRCSRRRSCQNRSQEPNPHPDPGSR